MISLQFQLKRVNGTYVEMQIKMKIKINVCNEIMKKHPTGTSGLNMEGSGGMFYFLPYVFETDILYRPTAESHLQVFRMWKLESHAQYYRMR